MNAQYGQARKEAYQQDGEEKTVSSSQNSAKAASAFRTISEVADELDVQQHVLRFWETKFAHVRPLKRGGGRRYYRPEDIALLKKIHHLLYTEGYTIKGVQKLLREQGKKHVMNAGNNNEQEKVRAAAIPESQPATEVAPVQPPRQPGLTAKQRAVLGDLLGELKELRQMVSAQEE